MTELRTLLWDNYYFVFDAQHFTDPSWTVAEKSTFMIEYAKAYVETTNEKYAASIGRMRVYETRGMRFT